MRSPNRLDTFYDNLCYLHKKYMVDIRFGQLMSNFFGWLYSEKGKDLFYPEEDEMLKYFKDYLKDNCSSYNEEDAE